MYGKYLSVSANKKISIKENVETFYMLLFYLTDSSSNHEDQNNNQKSLDPQNLPQATQVLITACDVPRSESSETCLSPSPSPPPSPGKSLKSTISLTKVSTKSNKICDNKTKRISLQIENTTAEAASGKLNSLAISQLQIENTAAEAAPRNLPAIFQPQRNVLTNNRPGYQCKQCDCAFNTYWSFLSHVETHSPAKKYNCTKCQSAFRWKSALNRHLLMHTGNHNKMECQYCLTRFRFASKLALHVKSCRSNPVTIEKLSDKTAPQHPTPAEQHPTNSSG